jgi:thiamine biosynthesis lipoprotein
MNKIALLVLTLTLLGCTKEVEIKEYKLAGDALGTTYHITYIGNEIDSLTEKIDSLIFGINHALSTYQENSLISAFNSNSGAIWDDPTNMRYFFPDLHHFGIMIKLSQEVSSKTNGAFDPSAARLFQIYDEAKKNGVEMDSVEVRKALSVIGIEDLEIDGNGLAVKTDPALMLNFNAIAKGYLVDLVALYIKQAGCENYMVEIGGEVKVQGTNFSNEAWKLGVNYPVTGDQSNEIFKVLELKDQSIATSGNYQNYYYIGDELIGHTIDPRTGKPIINNLKSASVIHKHCAVADAYATAFMVLGMDAVEIVEQDTSLSAYFIYENEEDGKLTGLFVE